MLVVKGGISHNIDEKNLAVYIEKGYKPAEIEKPQEDNISPADNAKKDK